MVLKFSTDTYNILDEGKCDGKNKDGRQPREGTKGR